MDKEIKPRYGIDPYLEWVKKEGLPVAEDYGIYLFDVETKMWPRFGVKAAACHLKGRGDFANMFLFEIPPGGSTVPQRHLYEEVVYVLEGTGKDEYYSGEGDLVLVRPGNHMWETNFVPDLEQLELQAWADRGGGSTNIMFVLADGIMHAHISEMPVGTYKKGHRHGAGAHVMCVVGEGFSLLWFDGDKDFL